MKRNWWKLQPQSPLMLKDKPVHPCTKSWLHFFQKVFCNFQVVFFIGITLGLQAIFQEWSREDFNPIQAIPEQGDVLYYGRKNLQVHYSDFAKSVLYRLVIKPHETSSVTVCDGKSFELHRHSGMGLRRVNIFQTLGDTNVHAVSAFLDDRLGNDMKFIRIVAVGLYPGPSQELYCNYECEDGEEGLCSVRMTAVLLPAGNQTDYKEDEQRKSLKDVLYLACPVRPNDKPTSVTLATNRCGYSHNLLNVSSFDVQGVVVPPRDIGICVRPLNTSRAPEEVTSSDAFALWVEYLRHIGADHVHLYISHLNDEIRKSVDFYESEMLRVLTTKQWNKMERELEIVVSEEAALNDCINQNMMAYRYILILSYGEIPVFESYPSNLKQLVRAEEFIRKMNIFSGYKVQPDAGSSRLRRAMIIKPRLTLATAGNHFIPLTGRPSFRMLDGEEVRIMDCSQRLCMEEMTIE